MRFALGHILCFNFSLFLLHFLRKGLFMASLASVANSLYGGMKLSHVIVYIKEKKKDRRTEWK